MSKRHEIEERLRALAEIRDILGAMKNLSLVEVRKLTRFLSAQRRVVAGIESAADDFLGYYPRPVSEADRRQEIGLLIGSERGFCGDFNESLLAALRANPVGTSTDGVALVVVGQRLSPKLGEDPRVASILEGPSVAEEVESVLARVIDSINRIQRERTAPRPLRLTVFHHAGEERGVRISIFQPFKRSEKAERRFSHPPRMNLPPPAFLPMLAEHYLFHHLHELFYDSLMAENLRRLQHMDNAIRTLDQDAVHLSRRRNALRQEEITEEIEVILLSAEVLKKS